MERNRSFKFKSSYISFFRKVFFPQYLFIWLCWVLVAPGGTYLPHQRMNLAPCTGSTEPSLLDHQEGASPILLK